MDSKYDLLARYAKKGQEKLRPSIPLISVGMATCGRAAGAAKIFATLESAIATAHTPIKLIQVGCRGLCFAEPLVEVLVSGQARMIYAQVTEDEARNIIDTLDSERNLLEEYPPRWILPYESLALLDTVYTYGPRSAKVLNLLDDSFMCIQNRQVLSECGLITPASFEEYAALGGYAACVNALLCMTPDEVIADIRESNLRGRGGAGFPTAKKWELCSQNAHSFAQTNSSAVFIVNADEGDPGAYMDRTLMESDPHRILEGMILGAYATGAQTAYIFIRSEYSLAVKTMQEALDQTYEAGFLGHHILDTNFSLEARIIQSAGAFICGEETAMINALENKRPRARKRPPYPTEKGLWEKATCINNVETLANIPFIIKWGAQSFKQLGTAKSSGTKVFSLAGSIRYSGLVEVSLGTPISRIIEHVHEMGRVKAIQIGGPSGSFLPRPLFDIPLDYESLRNCNSIMGSGGLVALNDHSCIVDSLCYFLSFLRDESCKSCKICIKELTKSAEILKRFCAGKAEMSDLDMLKRSADSLSKKALCGLGKSASNLILSSLTYFEDEFISHINGICPSLVCHDLIHFEIDQTKCQGERCCLQTCPGNAIRGRYGKPGHIVERLCTHCGSCMLACPYEAVSIKSGEYRRAQSDEYTC